MPTRPRSSWLGLGLAVALLGTSLSTVPALAAEAPVSISVELAPLGADGIGGLALLAPAEGGSSVQLLVVGAPAGTTAVVHAGDCAAIDPAPVGLLGDLGDGQLQAVLPLALEALADGRHVIALHPGLDLAVALGCGAIPAADLGPAPASTAPLPAPTAAVVGGAYTGPQFGFSITWDGTWTQAQPESLKAADRVTLNSGPSVLIVGAARVFEGDAAECLRAWEQGMLDMAVAGRIGGFTKLTVAEAPPPAGPSAAYGYSSQGADGSTAERVAHYECRTLGDGAIIEFILDTTADVYADALLARQAVVDSLAMPEGPTTSPMPVPVPAPSSPPIAGPDVAPVPAADRFYRSPDGGYSIAWQPPWERLPLADETAMVLSDGSSGVSFTAFPGADAEECLVLWRATYVDAMGSIGEIIEPRVFEPEQRTTGTTGQADPPVAISVSYVYRDAVVDGQPSKVTWVECRTFPGGALAINHVSREELYATEIAARQALLAGLTVPAAGAPEPAIPPGPQPTAGSASPPEPEPVPVPDPVAASPAVPVVVDPGCVGVPEWSEATIARFDRIEELRIEAREVGSYELVSFVASFAGQVAGMAARQEAGQVPALAAEANAAAIEALGILEESADLQYEGLSRGGGAGRSGSLSEGLRRFDEGMDAVNEVRKEAERLIAMCTPEG